MNKLQNESLIKEFYNDLWNRFDKGMISKILTKDISFCGSLGPHRKGHAEFAGYVEFVRKAFPDFHNEIVEIISEGDKSFVRLLYTGTHEGELFGIVPTHKRIHYEGAAVFKFRKDKISGIWVLGDIYGLFRQLHT